MPRKIRNQHYPWSAERLLWSFHSELDDMPEDFDTGEPVEARAIRRVNAAMLEWRNTHRPEDDPLDDDSLAPFHVNDIAVLVYECERLWYLEQRVMNALGPPSRKMRYDKKLDQLVPDETYPFDD